MARAGIPTADRRMTVAEFLDFDDGTDTRYELVEGRPVAMNPPKGRHVVITSNLVLALGRKLPAPRQPYFGGGVALCDEGDEYRMPDVFVSCTPVPDAYFDQPRLLIEVLSPSTAKEDRTAKLDFYKRFPSVEVVMLAWQDTRRVELHLRRPEGWLVTATIGQGTVAVPSLGLELSLDEIYAGL
jgi:Uma2 family endonuclease